MKTLHRTARRAHFGASLVLALLVLTPFTDGARAADPARLNVTQQVHPSQLEPGGFGFYEILVRNLSATVASGPITIIDTLPPGTTYTGFNDFYSGAWTCPTPPGATVVECTNSGLEPGWENFQALNIEVQVDPGATGADENHVAVTGLGGADASTLTTTFSTDPIPFGITGFEAFVVDPQGLAARQAGSHPDLTTRFSLSTKRSTRPDGGMGGVEPTENIKDVIVDLPPGLIGNPTAVPTCSAAVVADQTGQCPPESQVGITYVPLSYGVKGANVRGLYPVYNVVPPPGRPARFAFRVLSVVTTIDPMVRGDGEYRVSAEVKSASQTLALLGSTVTLWGVPADPSHDAFRGGPSTAPRLPFLTMPTSCPGESLQTKVSATSWQQPTRVARASSSTDFDGDPVVTEGCGQLDFDPKIEARPTTNLADSPSGLDVKVSVPQNEDPDGLATAQLRDATVTLPAGMTVNPSSANGLDACGPAQIGLISPIGQKPRFDEAPASCPPASKIGSVLIDTPLLDQPLNGAIYLATQGQNPFGSLLALYIAVEDPETGVLIKLAGHPVADPGTGQLTVSFDQNPQLPFNDLKVNLFTGPRAALKTPMACGDFTTTSTMVPWSSPEGATATPSDTFAITQGAGGGACLASAAQAPNKPAFSAGTDDPTAGTYSPFSLRVARADGTAPIKQIDATLPKGLLGKLAGISYCPDAALTAAAGKSGKAEQASSSCPVASRVGSVSVGAGAGSNPFYASGNAYLAGPYKGAPLSLAIVTPAVAGPFDLGTVVVRNRLEVNPETTQIHVVSDPIPTILQGIPLDIRSIVVSMDRPQFTLNPTSCDPTTVDAGALSVFGQNAMLSNRFQVGGCNALGFKPKLALRLVGPTHRSAFPRLRATLRARPGDANIGRAQVTLPKTEFLEQGHIRTVCTRVQYVARTCPEQSIYGYAKAWSPLVDQPLEGPVYLRSSSNALPDLVASLDGQIHVDLVGRIDSVNSRIRNTFESVPDAPVSKFVLTMQGGRKGLLTNNTELCKATPRASVKFDGQNGKIYDTQPTVKVDCKGKRKSKKHKHASKRAARN